MRTVEDLLMLGIDTSGKTASAALYDTENGIFLAQNTLYTQKTHSQVIMPICRDIIAQTGKKIEDVQAVAVANGPGSYTGLRIGVAAVKAMCFALDCQCCGVSTLEGMAYNNLQFHGIICSVMKARGELIYACAYKSDGTKPERLCEERLIGKTKFSEYLDSLDGDILLCGDGAEDFFTDSPSRTRSLAPPSSILQNAAGICLAASDKELYASEELTVSYLQKVKAEKDLEDKSKNN